MRRALAGTALALLASFSAFSQTIDEFPLPTQFSFPAGITQGPDGNLWFAEQVTGIGRITPGGVVTEFPLPHIGAGTTRITRGPDGNLWFGETNGDVVGRITPGGLITEFHTPSLNSFPLGITAGPDGNVWFLERGRDKIGRITPDGMITEYPEDFPFVGGLNNGITSGSDGNLWFAENSAFTDNTIGRITPAGVITHFPLPADAGPAGMTRGPDGNVWFTEILANKIGKITPAGVITEYSLPPPFSGPSDITVGPDGNLWFTDSGRIGTITTHGVVIRELPVPPNINGPGSLTSGPDGNIWFTLPLRLTQNGIQAEVCRVNIAVPPVITELSPAHLWIGLKNSDDQGTSFDLRVELLKNGTPVASGIQRCITGVTRNPAFAKEAVVRFDPFTAVQLASPDALALRVTARIGTNADETGCGGTGGRHAGAVGLRLYYDSASRASRFDATITPNPTEYLYLHSDGGACGSSQSPRVTNRFLDLDAPTAANPRCMDSGAVHFSAGNPFSLVGVWNLAPLP